MRENIDVFPAGEIERGPRRQKLEARLRDLGAALARQHRVELGRAAGLLLQQGQLRWLACAA